MSVKNRSLPVAVWILAGTAAVAAPASAQVKPPPAPLSRHTFERLQTENPELLRRLMDPPLEAAIPLAPPPAGSPWQSLPTQPPFGPGAMLQLTDGTVMVHQDGTPNWWRYTPDSSGNYLNGTWSQLASMQSGHAPVYFASAVLPDGRVIVEGGEYNLGVAAWTGLGDIYDPTLNTWTAVSPPAGMNLTSNSIGDAMGIVLANGTFMLSPVYAPASGPQQRLNATALTWTASGTGKADGNDEEGQVLLPNSTVLTVDVSDTGGLDHSEIYSPSTGAWSSAGSTVVQLFDSRSFEMGPALLRPDGTLFAIGATGHNAVYTLKTGAWAAAPDFPVIGGLQYDVADGPAAVLPDGHVLVMASPGVYNTPSHFFEFDGTALTQVADTPNAASLKSFYGYMLVLPTGQVMFNSRFGDIELYTSAGAPKAGWRPAITSVPTTLAAGGSYTLSGKRLSGLSSGAAYGDDYQSASNYPIVRIANTTSGHVVYARTTGFKVGVGPAKSSSTKFAVPSGIETGASTLEVIANGIASPPKAVTVTVAAMASN